MADPGACGLDDVTDSTDWLSTPLPGLSAVEAALRCQVCKDFYRTPMLTSCSHTFCSLCIRRAIANDGKCPLCRQRNQEINLRSNWSMEEVVASFERARTDVLEYAQKPAEVARSSDTPKRRPSVEILEGEREPKRLRSSARTSKSKGAELTAEMARQESETLGPESRRGSRQESTQDTKDAEAEYAPTDDGLVACPICLTRMKEVQVDSHLDTSCAGSPEAARQKAREKASRAAATRPNGFQTLIKSTPPKSFERLPTLNYSIIKDQPLRKKLADLGIPSGGARQTMEKRHKEWITLWNANCDSLHPRTKRELLQELDAWERATNSWAPRTANVGAQIKAKDFDQAAWSTKHDSSFKDLIASARKSRPREEPRAKEPTPPEATPLPMMPQANVGSTPPVLQTALESPRPPMESKLVTLKYTPHHSTPPTQISAAPSQQAGPSMSQTSQAATRPPPVGYWANTIPMPPKPLWPNMSDEEYASQCQFELMARQSREKLGLPTTPSGYPLPQQSPGPAMSQTPQPAVTRIPSAQYSGPRQPPGPTLPPIAQLPRSMSNETMNSEPPY